MNILNLFEAVYISHVLSLVKKGLECRDESYRHSVKKLYRCTYMFCYDLQQFCLFNVKVSMLGIGI